MMNKLLILSLLFMGVSCTERTQFFEASHSDFRYGGRIDFSDTKAPVFISSASFVEFKFRGTQVVAVVQNLLTEGERNYLALEVDGDYKGRIKLSTSEPVKIPISVSEDGEHGVRLFKATEAETGGIAFLGLEASEVLGLDPKPSRKIEFIGNSITCGAAADLSDIPCGEGSYQDQHNGYLSFATQSAIALDAQFTLASVSGKGMYRNWNSLSPTIPETYENLYLGTDSSRKHDFTSYTPDMVSIFLGTNDMSNGDRIKERLPFDSTAFIDKYVEFIGTVYEKYPDTQICLMSFAFVEVLHASLKSVQQQANAKYLDKKAIEIVSIQEGRQPSGCTGHPSIEDHKLMSDLLIPQYKKVMGW